LTYSKHIKDLIILQIVPQLKQGGVERGTLDIFRYLNKNKIKNYIFCESYDSDLLTIEEKKSIFTSNGLKFKKLFNFFKLNFLLSELVEINDINLIHISSRAPAFIFYKNIKNKKINYVTSFHNPYTGIFLKKFYNSYLLKGDVVICNSNFTKNYLINNFKIDKKKIFSVPRGTDLEYFNPENISQSTINDKKKSLNLSKKDIILSVPSRFSKWKGHKQILSFLSSQSPTIIKELKLILIIDKSKLNEDVLFKNCNPLLKKNIRIIHPTRNIKEIYAISDIIISCSLKPEGFGRTISESLAMNKIPIGSNYGGVKEQLEQFDSKLLFDQNNLFSFTKSLNYALTLNRKKNFNGRDYIDHKYSLSKMLKDTLNIYCSL
jgi:glycosyltransferase involved in cell wall biosynthesis